MGKKGRLFKGVPGMIDYMKVDDTPTPVPFESLVDCDMGRFGSLAYFGIDNPEVEAGYRFVLALAGDEGNWVSQSEEVPWSKRAEEAVSARVDDGSRVDRKWLLGVMQALRSAKTTLLPRQLAAGFLVLSRLTGENVRKLLPGVNLAATCDGGCKMSDIVPLAAKVARQKLGLA